MPKNRTITHDNIVNPDSIILVKFYSRKPLLKRRQWYWRATHTVNGRKLCIGGEGYNNLDDCENSYRLVALNLRYAPTIVERPYKI